MFDEPLTLYKLIILYMLDRVSSPLTVAHVSDFILGHDYTDFVTINRAINELKEAGMLALRPMHNRTHLLLTKEGQETLRFFENRIGDAIKEDVKAYLKENEFTLRNDVSVVGDYYKTTSGEYEARLIAKERGVNLVELTLSVPTEEMASSICDHWQAKSQEVYQTLARLLF